MAEKRSDARQSIVLINSEFDSNVRFRAEAPMTIIKMLGCIFSHRVEFQGWVPDTIILKGVTFSTSTKLSSFHPGGKKPVLILSDVSGPLIIDPDKFDFYIPEEWSYTEKTAVCKDLLDRFRKDNYEGDAYKDVDIQYQKIKLKHRGLGIFVWLQEQWWNFGYNREYIFKNTLLLFYAYFLINIFIFKNLIRNTYPIEKIQEEFNHSYDLRIIRRGLYRLWLCLVYTFIIFFGLKLELSKLNLKKVALATYISIIYLTGLICNGFLLGYIFNK